MKIEISSKVEIDLSKDLYSIQNNLSLRSEEFKNCYNQIYDYCKILRLRTTSYPYLLDISEKCVFSKIVIETHSGSMIDNDSLLINEFNILIEKIENIFKYIKWNLSVL